MLHYYGSYIRNKDNAGLLTTFKYKQFFATPKKQAKTEKKRKFRYHTVKGRSLVPDLVTCYSRDAQREWMKLSLEVT